MKKLVLLILAAAMLILACGQLITPKASPVAQADTATPEPEIAVTLLPTVTAKPTATPRPATPEPTPTPTVTPTPVLYTVQSGDTLLAIAAAYNIPAEAIQAANGIIDPRSLQIDQVLIIPEPQDENAEPTPTTTPFPVAIQGVNFQRVHEGSLWAFGEVVNPGSTLLSEMVVEVNLYDANGKLLSSKAAFTALDLLAAGGSVPFSLLFDDPPSTFAQYQVAAISAVPLLGNTRYYLDLTPIEMSTTQIGQATYRVSGQLQNIGQHNADTIKLVATAYDDTGKVVAMRQVDLDVNILRSGARTPFEIDLTAPDAVISRYGVQAQALRAE